MTAPITPDERAAMRERYQKVGRPSDPHDEDAWNRYWGDPSPDVLRLLDALDTAEAERDEARAAIARRRALWEHERATWSDALTFDRRDRDEARAEAARLRAATSPAWDEDTVTEAACQAVTEVYERHGDHFQPDEEEMVTAVLAVVRRHLPVRPDRETIARAIDPRPWDPAHTPIGWSLPTIEAARARSLKAADAVLALWPGESRATVQAAALRDAADWLARMDDGRDTGHNRAGRDIIARLRDRAAQFRPRGADRG